MHLVDVEETEVEKEKHERNKRSEGSTEGQAETTEKYVQLAGALSS
jgi:hypothetical protein